MKASARVLASFLVFGLSACQWPGTREAAAPPTPTPAVASAAPAASTPLEPPPAEAAAPAAAPAAAAASSPASAAPAPARRPEPEAIVLPAGTELAVRLQQAVSSDKSQVEDSIEAELAKDVSAHGRVVLPAGTEVVTRVVVATRSGRVKGRARLVVDFEAVRVEGKRLTIDAPRWDITAGSSAKRDAAIAGGAAAAGAIIGAIAGGGKGALKGAAIGGAAGGGAVLVTRGNEVELPAGSVHTIALRQELRIE